MKFEKKIKNLHFGLKSGIYYDYIIDLFYLMEYGANVSFILSSWLFFCGIQGLQSSLQQGVQRLFTIIFAYLCRMGLVSLFVSVENLKKCRLDGLTRYVRQDQHFFWDKFGSQFKSELVTLIFELTVINGCLCYNIILWSPAYVKVGCTLQSDAQT